MNEIPSRLSEALADRYTIQRKLGEGGMATVYLADDVKHERKVALKVLKPELAAVVGADRFLTEIRTTAKLQHLHILPLHGWGEADGLLFYVMPYVEGESGLEPRGMSSSTGGPSRAVRFRRECGWTTVPHDRVAEDRHRSGPYRVGPGLGTGCVPADRPTVDDRGGGSAYGF